MRLLLVEDARLIREPLSRALELAGWEVEAVPDGEAALARLAVAPVDAVVLDIMLPGKDGLSVLSELRARGDATPVILLTARGDVRDRVRGLDLGADDYLGQALPCRGASGAVARRSEASWRHGSVHSD